MGLTTIEWTDRTWNPWHGCHKISPGCKFCYMFRDKARYGQDANTVVRSKTTFYAPLSWPRQPMMCFTCSWSDWFIEEADEWRDEAYRVIEATPWITYQILTKRADRMVGRIPNPPLPNIWFGVSAENQHWADLRIVRLLDIPAAIRFVSYEPALGPLEIMCRGIGRYSTILRDSAAKNVDWVIAGGESGPKARPANARWFIDMRDDCTRARVPFFFKQWGEFLPCGESAKGAVKTDWGYVQRVGKKAAGRLLEGREWNKMPMTANGVHP